MPIKKLYNSDEEIVINSPSNIQDVSASYTSSLEELKDKKQDTSKTCDNEELFNTIKNIFKEDKPVYPKEIYFKPSKGIVKYNIDDSVFMPSHFALLNVKNFEKIYLQELESIIYNTKDELDTNKLLPLIILFSYINRRKYPIQIVSANYRKFLFKICKVLNDFMNRNFSVIRSIYETFNSIKDTEEEQRSSQIEK